ncbi:hypothetical protein JVU11DRAFT_2306 [Chiua virens]|nr:hypothetical protein JVU11DRAFT_2306 [Chiua virens]
MDHAKPSSFPSHTPPSFYSLSPFPSHTALHNHLDLYMDPLQPRYPSTCIPSLMPPGIDPTSVDFRTFFPYIPNEVKHRKRTSRHQLKVLEDVFRKDTKPNAVLRKKLAAELEMSPRAVQVRPPLFLTTRAQPPRTRRAKEKALRKRVSGGDQDKDASPSIQKSPPSRDASPNDSSNSSTATEKPPRQTEHDISAPPSTEPSSSPVLKLSCSPPLIPLSPSTAWPSSSGTPVDILPHIRPLGLDPNGQDQDLYSARRGSLPAVMPSQPPTGPSVMQLPVHYPDRRKSMDVSFYRLMNHPFARIAKEKNEALFLPKSPAFPCWLYTSQLGAFVWHGAWCGSPPDKRPCVPASAPDALPSCRPLQSHPAPLRRFSDNRLYAITSRTLSPPIPGPLPTPDFQFGNPSSTSPSNASPTPGDVESPSVPLQSQSPEIAQLQRWSFPRSREPDQDTEDSGSYSGLSRFGSVASVSGSDSSAIYSDVSSCVAVDHMGYDPSTRRGSCASGNFLELRLSGLNMTGRSSQGSLGEAQLNAAALAYRDKLARQEHSSDVIGGYISPASTASPGTSSHVRPVKEAVPSGLRSEGIYDYSPLSQVPEIEEIAATRRASIQVQEPLSNIYVQNPLESQGSYSTPSSEAGTPSGQSMQPQHYPQGSGFIPQSGFSLAGEPSFVSGAGSSQSNSPYQPQPLDLLQYSPEGTFRGAPNTMGISQASVSRYTPSTSEYTYAAGHGQEPFAPLT